LTELAEDVARQLHVVLGQVESSLGAVLVETLVDELIDVWVGDACQDVR